MKHRAEWSVILLVASAACASGPATPVVVVPTDKGVATTISAPLERTAEWTTKVFQELGIRLKEVESDADAREYTGTHDKLNVRAHLTRGPAGVTRITIIALDASAAPEKVYAEKVLQKIARKQK